MEKCAGFKKINKSRGIPGADRNSGDFSPGKVPGVAEKVPRGSGPARFLADFQEIPGKSSAAEGFLGKK